MPDTPHMTGKVVLVTGGTAGIGKATAAGLAALAPGSASPDATVSAPRPQQPRSAA
jgi:NAD(P)-dependent dehydrogenase (short-subunit alcohol dehydrogenase family)